MEYLLQSDAEALKVATVPCDDDAEHSYYRANWLGPLKNRHWLPLEKGKGERPSAKGLAFLLADQLDVRKRLGEPQVAALLNVLGISAAEVALQSVGKDDADRLSLMQSFAAISELSGNDPVKVQELAEAIRGDPQALEVLKEREARRRRVEKNQKLGDLVERLFRDSFDSSGLTVTRTRAGARRARRRRGRGRRKARNRRRH